MVFVLLALVGVLLLLLLGTMTETLRTDLFLPSATSPMFRAVWFALCMAVIPTWMDRLVAATSTSLLLLDMIAVEIIPLAPLA